MKYLQIAEIHAVMAPNATNSL